MITCARRRFSSALLAALTLAVATPGRGEDVKLVDVVPRFQSGETTTDSEPNVAVDPANPHHIVVSAFTPCPPMISTVFAPIYFSTDGGDSWHLNCIVPGNNAAFGTGDITIRFAGHTGVLYAGTLNGSSFLELNVLRTANFAAPTPMTLLVSRSREDQPYTQAYEEHGSDHVFIGNNNLLKSTLLGGTGGQTASEDLSQDAASAAPPAGFGTDLLEERPTCGQDLPPVRTAIHDDGTVYLAYFRNEVGSPCFSGSNTADLVVARDDHWGTGGFKALTDAGDGKPGVRVASGLNITWLQNLGTERVGAQLSIAVDPKDRKTVYVAWGDGLDPANFTLHVRSSNDGGLTWSPSDLKTVVSATNPALAINREGTVGFLYQKLVNPGTCQGGGPGIACWETHFEQHRHHAWKDLAQPLANVPDNVSNYLTLGDYNHVLAVGETFHGAFSANNYPDKKNFHPAVKFHRHVDWVTHKLFADAAHTVPVSPSVDPFYFKVSD